MSFCSFIFPLTRHFSLINALCSRPTFAKRRVGETVIFRSSRVINIIRWFPVFFLITSVFNVRSFNHIKKYPWNILVDFIAGSRLLIASANRRDFFVAMETAERRKYDSIRRQAGMLSRCESRSKISYCLNWTCHTVTLRESLITDCLFWRDRPSTDTTGVRAK